MGLPLLALKIVGASCGKLLLAKLFIRSEGPALKEEISKIAWDLNEYGNVLYDPGLPQNQAASNAFGKHASELARLLKKIRWYGLAKLYPGLPPKENVEGAIRVLDSFSNLISSADPDKDGRVKLIMEKQTRIRILLGIK